MHRHDVAAHRTLVLGFLALQESVDAVFFQFSEVAHHAHSVAFTVTPVQAVHVAARHGFALKTETNRVFREFFAASFDEAVLVPGKTA
jgi:hypothetical protein